MAADANIVKVRRAWSNRTHRAYRELLVQAEEFIRAFAYGDVSPFELAKLRIEAETWLDEYSDYLGEETEDGEEASD